MAKLYVLSGPDVGRSYEVLPGALIGRAAECPVHLRDASVSRQHARIEESQGEWAVTDLDSRNGLRVRGARVPRAVLADGDEFELGEVLLRFRCDASEAQAGPAATHAGPAARHAGPAAAHAGPGDGRAEIRERAVEPAGEIELEGDWSNVTHVPAVPSRAPAARPVSSSRAAAHGPAAAAVPGSPSDVRAAASAAVSQSSALRAAGAAAASRPGAGAAQRGILQYQREPERQGFFSADLAQQPLWVRLAVWTAALALFVALFWLAFRGTAFLKGKAQGRPDAALDARDAEETAR